MLSILLNLILLSCGWLLLAAAGCGLYRCMDMAVNSEIKRYPRFYGGYVALCNLKNECMLFRE